MSFDIASITTQLESNYGISVTSCTMLPTLANYALEVISPAGHFALKIYNPTSRTFPEVQWEIDLTLHLIRNSVLVARPIPGKGGSYLQNFQINNTTFTVVLFEWAKGEKPKPELATYRLMGEVAAQVHTAADPFTSTLPREVHDAHELIDDSIQRLDVVLRQTDQYQKVFDLCERMRRIIVNPDLDYGIIHNDLTLDNVHLDHGKITVFDFDSAAKSWRSAEPWGVLRAADDRFHAWLDGYRSTRAFNDDNERAVAAFVIVEDVRNVVWKLGFAKSSRGTPLMRPDELPKVIDNWLQWEHTKITKNRVVS